MRSCIFSSLANYDQVIRVAKLKGVGRPVIQVTGTLESVPLQLRHKMRTHREMTHTKKAH